MIFQTQYNIMEVDCYYFFNPKIDFFSLQTKFLKILLQSMKWHSFWTGLGLYYLHRKYQIDKLI